MPAQIDGLNGAAIIPEENRPESNGLLTLSILAAALGTFWLNSSRDPSESEATDDSFEKQFEPIKK